MAHTIMHEGWGCLGLFGWGLGSVCLAEFPLVGNLFLYPQEDGGEPLVQPRHLIIGLDLVSKSFNVFLFQVMDQRLMRIAGKGGRGRFARRKQSALC